MASPPFQISGQPGKSGVHVLTARGPITFASSSLLYDAVIAVAAPRVIIDMSQVPSVDSMAVGALVRAYVHCQKTGKKMGLVGLSPRVRVVLHLTGVDPLFDTYPTLQDAEDGLA